MRICAFSVLMIASHRGFIRTYQRVPGLHEQLSGAVPDAIRDACRSVHGANAASLSGIFGGLHQLHRQAQFSEGLDPRTGWRALLPQLKMAIMAHR